MKLSSNLLLALTGVVETATGLMLLIAPSSVVQLLLGAAPGSLAGDTVCLVAGSALVALGVTAWLARQDAGSRAANGFIAGMLLYNLAVSAILVRAWAGYGLPRSGPRKTSRRSLEDFCLSARVQRY